jgi:hypothetical protein
LNRGERAFEGERAFDDAFVYVVQVSLFDLARTSGEKLGSGDWSAEVRNGEGASGKREVERQDGLTIGTRSPRK